MEDQSEGIIVFTDAIAINSFIEPIFVLQRTTPAAAQAPISSATFVANVEFVDIGDKPSRLKGGLTSST
ncbi:MAG: hypothetical protein WC664_03265 [Patescibacteria group bacterium]